MRTNHNSTTPAADILVVDDSPEGLRLLTQILTRAGYRVRVADRPHAALESALEHPPSLILLDVRMPEMSGWELCRHLKENERTADIPVIFVSALQDVEDRVQAFEAGGVDFVSKPFQEAEVLARVKTHLQLRTMQLQLETLVAERTAKLTEANEALKKEVQARNIVRQALAESEKKYRTVVERAAEGILVLQDGRRQYYNPAWLEMTGYSAEEYGSMPFLSMVHADDLETIGNTYQQLVMGRQIDAPPDFRITTKSGNIKWLSIRTTLVEWEGKLAEMVFFRDITERKQAEQNIQQYQQRLKALASQLTIAEERERRHIAANLHDEVGQSLAFARIQIATAREAVVDPEAAAMLDEASNTIRQAIRDTRDLVFDLSSPLLNELGLAAALAEWLKEEVEKKHGLQTELIDTAQGLRLDEDMRAILFKNIRELVTNVVRHAQASKVTVRLAHVGDEAIVVVEDNGCGFEPLVATEAVERAGGFGLFSIRERMLDLGGALEIVSEPGQCCTAILTVPLGKS